VKPASIKDDLFRRDFTINAMAIELSTSHYGQLIDLFGGQDDLEHKLIRVLHEKSFIDDATRIWRGLRYEQRLNFRLETVTLQLLKRDTSYLDKVSGDRIRHELELVLKEAYPEKVLSRADELGVLAKLHPALKGDGWQAGKFEQARKLSSPDSPSTELYLSLLAYR
jgi:tRNA nucleotidyltransferase (CCA-adding enzyme)